jgi:hypothetical protein
MTTIRRPRLVASVAIAALVSAAVPSSSLLAATASLGGRVVGLDGISPLAGAIVRLVGEDGTSVGHSRPTGADGAFAIEPAPTGTYRLLVETAEGAFLAPEPVQVAAGANPAVALSLQARPSFQFEPGFGSGALPTWGKYLIVGAIAVGGLFVIHQVSEDEEEDASPF